MPIKQNSKFSSVIIILDQIKIVQTVSQIYSFKSTYVHCTTSITMQPEWSIESLSMILKVPLSNSVCNSLELIQFNDWISKRENPHLIAKRWYKLRFLAAVCISCFENHIVLPVFKQSVSSSRKFNSTINRGHEYFSQRNSFIKISFYPIVLPSNNRSP